MKRAQRYTPERQPATDALDDRAGRRRFIAECLREAAERSGARIALSERGVPVLEDAHRLEPGLRLALARAVLEYTEELVGVVREGAHA